MSSIEEIAAKRQAATRERVQATSSKASNAAMSARFDKLENALHQITYLMLDFLQVHEPKVEVTNFPTAPTSINTPDVEKVVNSVENLTKTVKQGEYSDAGLIKAIQKLEQKLETLPAKMPEVPKPLSSIDINNLSILADKIDELKPLLEKELPTPQVNVEAPEQAQDLKPLEDKLDRLITLFEGFEMPDIPQAEPIDLSSVEGALKAVRKAVDDKPVPGTTVVQTDPLIRYTPADIDDAGLVQYFGFVATDGAWYIRQFDTGSAPKTIRFSFGSANYTTNWINRSGLTYSLWSQ